MGEKENVNPVENNKVEETQNYSILAIISFVFSLIGLFRYAFPCGIVSLIIGIIGLTKINKSGEKGKWMAIVGIVLGVLEILYFLLLLGLGASLMFYNFGA